MQDQSIEEKQKKQEQEQEKEPKKKQDNYYLFQTENEWKKSCNDGLAAIKKPELPDVISKPKKYYGNSIDNFIKNNIPRTIPSPSSSSEKDILQSFSPNFQPSTLNKEIQKNDEDQNIPSKNTTGLSLNQSN